MPAIQSLKKKLKGIQSTKKLTKAMKTVSTVKFSKLSDIYGKYSQYAIQCRKIYDNFGSEFDKFSLCSNEEAPVLYVVFSSNKGLCGNFNSEILKKAMESIDFSEKYRLIVCGKKAAGYFKDKNIHVTKEFILNDIPDFDESNKVFDYIVKLREKGEISRVKLIYSKYVNMLKQEPCCDELFCSNQNETDENVLFMPDKESFAKKAAQTVFSSMFYGVMLETAIGAQAATLMTMRSAYDTATQYYSELEGEINKIRQSTVTADVIETSAERV